MISVDILPNDNMPTRHLADRTQYLWTFCLLIMITSPSGALHLCRTIHANVSFLGKAPAALNGKSVITFCIIADVHSSVDSALFVIASILFKAVHLPGSGGWLCSVDIPFNHVVFSSLEMHYKFSLFTSPVSVVGTCSVHYICI